MANFNGDQNDNTLTGGAENDYLQGSGGNDTIDGGAGVDVAAFGLPTGTPGSFRSVQGVDADADSWIIELVDGSNVQQVFKITPGAQGATQVTGLGIASGLGTDTIRNVEELHFQVFNDPFNPNQFLSFKLAPTAWVYEPNHDVGVDGTVGDDTINLADYHQDKDASWDRFVNAGAGNDTVNGTSLNERLNGDAGDDVLNGGGGHDELKGGAGNDTIDGGAGGDAAAWELPSDLVGKLQIQPGANASEKIVERVDGSTTEQLFRITIGQSSVTVTGLNSQADAGTDTITTIEELRFYIPGRPQDGASWFFGPSPYVDELNRKGGVNSGDANDTIFLTDFHGGRDVNTWAFTLNGGGGDDQIHGMGSVDTLNGGLGKDNLFGNGGNDTLNGGGGDDYLSGGPGDDAIDGGAGADVAAFGLPTGTPGTFRAVQGAGANAGSWIIELVDGANVQQVFKITPGAQGVTQVTGLGMAADLGTDTVRNVEDLHFQVFNEPFNPAQFLSFKLAPTAWVYEPNQDVGVDGTVGDDIINLADYHQDKDASWDRIVNAGAGNDSVYGTAFNERLNGDAGNDVLNGGGGNDELRGGAGDDTIDGGAGADVASYEIAADLVGKLQAVAGANANETLIQRVDGATIETMFQVTFGEAGITVKAVGAYEAVYGVDTLTTIEEIRFYVVGRPSDGAAIYLGPAPWTDEVNKIAGVNGGPGDDVIRVVDLHADKDFSVWTSRVQAGAGNDQVYGTAGVDQLTGGLGNDFLFGNGGDDTLNGADGNDNLNGWRGNDILNGGLGDDVASYSLEDDTAGQLQLVQGTGDDAADWFVRMFDSVGGTSTPVFRIARLQSGEAQITGLGPAADLGMDRLSSVEMMRVNVTQNGVLKSLTVNLRIMVSVNEAQKFASATGSIYNDTLTMDVVLAGRDGTWTRVLSGGFGNDTLHGSAYRDNLDGDSGDDILNGNGGDDYLRGGGGADQLNGGDGADTVGYFATDNTPGVFRIVAGTGADAGYSFVEIVDGANPAERLFKVAKLESGKIEVTGLGQAAGAGVDTLDSIEMLNLYVTRNSTRYDQTFNIAVQTNTYVGGSVKNANVYGSVFGETINVADYHQDKDATWHRYVNAGAGDDTVNGASSGDTLEGDAGDDILNGGGGDDYLRGGGGADQLNGGEGNDTVGYSVNENSPGLFQMVAGTGVEAGHWIIELVDGAVHEALFRVTKLESGKVQVTGLGQAAGAGTDILDSVEMLHLYVSQNGASQDKSFKIAPTVHTYVNGQIKSASVDGSLLNDIINLTDLHGDKDASWNRFVSAGAGNDTVNGTDLGDTLDGQDGDDILNGRGGDDYLNGQSGNDTLDGGAGMDIAGFRLPEGTAGTLRAVAGTGVDLGAWFIELVNGQTVTQVYKVTRDGPTYKVLGLNLMAGDGEDTVTHVEQLHFYVLNNSSSSQFVSLGLAPVVQSAQNGTVKNVWFDGSIEDDVIDADTLFAGYDSSWSRSGRGGAGNDTITGGSAAESLHGEAGDDIVNAGGGADSLFGGDGRDTLDGGDGDDRLTGGAGDDTLRGGAGADVGVFNLPTGTPGSYRAVAGTGADAASTFIERVDGATVERVFKITTASDGVVTVQGMGTAAGLGTDTLTGVERLHFYPEPYDQARFVQVNLSASVGAITNGVATVFGTIVGDNLDVAALYPSAGANSRIVVYGEAGNDTLKGHEGVNWLFGGLGDDQLSGLGGDDLLGTDPGVDTYDGGAGFDRVSFANVLASQGAVADLATGEILNDGFGNAETMTSIEALGGGTVFVDKFYGDAGGNLFTGGTGDIIDARGGDDNIVLQGAAASVDGGAGVDSLRLDTLRLTGVNTAGTDFIRESARNGVTVDLSAGKILDDGFGQGGVVLNIENVTGAGMNDTLVGDAANNELYGLAGADVLIGGDGDDLLVGGLGNDTLVGGKGVDTVLFAGVKAGYQITAVAGGYTVKDINASDVGGDEGLDTLSGVEILRFVDGETSLVSGVSIGPATVSLNEGNSGVTYFDFVVTRDNTLSALVLPYVIAPGESNGVSDADITGMTSGALRGAVSFAVGQATATVRVPVVGDTAIEAIETFTVTLSQPDVGLVTFVRQQATGRILNDDNVTNIPSEWARGINFGDPHLVTLDGLQYEMQGVGEFTLIKSTAGPAVDVQVRTAAVNAYASEITSMATMVGTARVTVDGTRPDAVWVNGVALTFPAGQTTVAVGNGSISHYSQNGTEGWLISFSGETKAALIVLDLGDRLDVSFATDPSRAGQFQGLLGNFDGNSANDLALPDGTAMPQPVSFADFYNIYVNAWRISQGASMLDYANGQSTTTFTDLNFPPAQATVNDFPADLVAAAEAAATAAGITDPALKAAAVRDYLLTGDAGFLTSGAGASGTAPPTVSADVGPSATVAASVGVGALAASHDEGHSGTVSYTFKVYRTSGSGTLDVDWAVTGQSFEGASVAANAADFAAGQPLTGTVSFASGETEKTVTILVKGDADYEQTEGFKFAITPTTNVPVIAGSVLATIVNDDAPPVPELNFSASVVSHSEGDNGTTAFVYTVQRSGSTAGASSVNWAVTGDVDAADFGGTLPSGVLTFAAGESSKTITLNVSGDTAFEPTESFKVSLSGAAGATIGLGTAIGAIVNDDAAPVTAVGFAAATIVEKQEGSATTVYEYVVTRSGDVSAASTVAWAVGGGTANGADFVGGALPGGTLSFAAGETTGTISISVVGDNGVEPDETFTVTLSSPSVGGLTYATAQGVILNDDTTPPPSSGGGNGGTGGNNGGGQPTPPTAEAVKEAFLNLTGVSAGGKTTSPTITLPNGQVIANPVYEEAQALNQMLTGYANGTVTTAQLLDAIVDASEDTSMVALQAYQFFTGKTPTKLGMSYLIDSPDNPSDLTDPAFALFNVGNRFINFAVNLGRHGEGQEAFAQGYGALTFEAAVAKAYEAIIGRANAQADGVNVDAAIQYLVSQKDFFATVGKDDLGSKAAMVGFIMYVGVEFETGKYYDATVDYLGDMFTGTPTYNVDLMGATSSSLMAAELY